MAPNIVAITNARCLTSPAICGCRLTFPIIKTYKIRI
jgi:hypothetical protein